MNIDVELVFIGRLNAEISALKRQFFQYTTDFLYSRIVDDETKAYNALDRMHILKKQAKIDSLKKFIDGSDAADSAVLATEMMSLQANLDDHSGNVDRFNDRFSVWL